MRQYASLDEARLSNAWLTIGVFDGVHRGHQAILQALTAGAAREGAPAVVMTFFPHPGVVLGRRTGLRYLTSPQEKASLLQAAGIDALITQPFDLQIAATPAAEFVQWLAARLGLRRLFAGPDFALGHRRQGDIPALRQLGEEHGFSVEVIPPVQIGGQTVSSSGVRDLLSAGEVEAAAEWLGRPFALSGKVVHGDGRGRSIGIPTANLEVWDEQALPRSGVYICEAWLGQAAHPAVVNIGVRPTFDGLSPVVHVEAHLLDFDRDLYGHQLRLAFLQRLRPEQKFPGVEALVAQIHADIQAARAAWSERVLLLKGGSHAGIPGFAAEDSH